MNLQKLTKLDLKNSSGIDEKWIQDQIAADPSILGLGDLILKDKERIQPNAGRLDLLLQDPESGKRYEVELQLGRTDESHIIRTIEYWDIERKRYPNYDHCAVIVAEDITSRFLNVIQLFNGTIPIIAIQMSAFDVSGNIALVFTKVLDELSLGLDDEDDDDSIALTDRAYWENRATKESVKLADELLGIINEIDPAVELKYNKFYIGSAKNGSACNFALMRPRKNNIKFELKIAQSDEAKKILDDNDIEVIDYNTHDGRYCLRLGREDIAKNRAPIKSLVDMAYRQWYE